MLTPPKKGQYALRAIYELARRKDQGPTKISTISAAQAIPRRFLDVILNQFKGSGLVVSKRGFYGGYTLAKDPDQITVGDVLRYLLGNADTVRCLACVSLKGCPFPGQCAFLALWRKVRSVAFKIYDETIMQHLLDFNVPEGMMAKYRLDERAYSAEEI